jgi:hypothetical protein
MKTTYPPIAEDFSGHWSDAVAHEDDKPKYLDQGWADAVAVSDLGGTSLPHSVFCVGRRAVAPYGGRSQGRRHATLVES